MQKLLILFALVHSSFAYASPSCLATGECFEYEGQLIDMRSDASRALDALEGCDPLIENCLMAQASRANTTRLTQAEFQTLLGEDSPELFIPMDIQAQDMALLAGALSLGTIVFANDREIMDFVQDHRTEQTQAIANFGNIMGREAILPIAAGSYFIGAVMDNGRLRQVGMFTVAAGLATQIVAEAFKKSFNRMRPNASQDPYAFFEDDNYSFISGHSSAAFSLATVIAHVYRDKPLIPILAYGVASLTAYARMQDNKHWASDVLAGAIAGHLVTKVLIRTLERSGTQMPRGLTVMPYSSTDQFGHGVYGVQVQWTPKKKETLKCKESGFEGRELLSLCLQEAFARNNR